MLFELMYARRPKVRYLGILRESFNLRPMSRVFGCGLRPIRGSLRVIVIMRGGGPAGDFATLGIGSKKWL